MDALIAYLKVSIPILRVGVQHCDYIGPLIGPLVSIPILRVGVQLGLYADEAKRQAVSIPILRVGVQRQ